MAEGDQRERPSQAFISFSGSIHVGEAESIINAATGALDAGVHTAVLCLASFGGNFARSLSLGNMLRALPFRFVTFNVGITASAANVLFLSGEERFAARHATFGFHPSSVTLNGELDPNELEERRVALLADDEREERIIAERTKLTRAQARGLVRRSGTLTAREALDAGIIQAVKELEIPPGALVLSA